RGRRHLVLEPFPLHLGTVRTRVEHLTERTERAAATRGGPRPTAGQVAVEHVHRERDRAEHHDDDRDRPQPRHGPSVRAGQSIRPSCGLDASAYRRTGIRPAPRANRPATTACRIAWAIATGSWARVTAEASSTAS